MRLTVLGAGPAYSDRDGATGAAYLVEHDGTRLLLDLGQGSLPRCFAHCDPAALDAVVVSHLHPDHFIDLVPLRHYLRYECTPSARVRVIAPEGLERRLDALHEEPGFTAAALDVEALADAPVAIGSLALEARRIRHGAGSRAFRLSSGEGPGLVYSGDCGDARDLVPLVRPGDALLVEVAFGTGPVPPGAMHLDAPAVAALALASAPGRLLLTHLQMGHDPDATLAAISGAWSGPAEFVWPGSIVELGAR